MIEIELFHDLFQSKDLSPLVAGALPFYLILACTRFKLSLGFWKTFRGQGHTLEIIPEQQRSVFIVIQET